MCIRDRRNAAPELARQAQKAEGPHAPVPASPQRDAAEGGQARRSPAPDADACLLYTSPNGDKRRGFAVGAPARRSRDGNGKLAAPVGPMTGQRGFAAGEMEGE